MDNPTEEYIQVGATFNRHTAELWSLVLLSAGIAHITEYQDSKFVIMAPVSQAAQAGDELTSFAHENQGWPPRKDPEPEGDNSARPPTVLLMGSLLIFYQLTGPFTPGNEWFSRGAVDSEAIIRNGEWWRLITALTLHADPVHLLGNILIGGLIIHFLCQRFGTGRAWFFLLLAGTAANFANVMARGPGHISVGFSTTVFAAVGLLCGGRINRINFRSFLLPLGAGTALLAMLGSSGERTDLGAHLWGLVIGLLLGATWRWLDHNSRLSARWGKQTYLLVLTLLIIWLAWARALAG